MSTGLQAQLIGVWKLVSWVEKPVDGSSERLPLGENPKGVLIYHPDGYVSAQLMRRDRRPFASGDWAAGTAAEYQAEGISYFAYCGPFQTDDGSQIVTHSAEVSLFPNWTGQVVHRHVAIGNDILQLSTVDPYVSGGSRVHACMTWKRAEPS